MSEQEKKQVDEVRNIFFNNGHKLLRSKKAVPVTICRIIDDLYFKYLDPFNNITYFNVLRAELEDLKKDPFCKHNHNKACWVKSYMLEWIVNLPLVVDEDFLFSNISGRESYCFIIKNAYEKQ